MYEVFVIVTKWEYGGYSLSGEEIFTSEEEADRVADEDRVEFQKLAKYPNVTVQVMKLTDWIFLQREISESEGYSRGERNYD